MKCKYQNCRAEMKAESTTERGIETLKWDCPECGTTWAILDVRDRLVRTNYPITALVHVPTLSNEA
jgi:hypothetical protein